MYFDNFRNDEPLNNDLLKVFNSELKYPLTIRMMKINIKIGEEKLLTETL